MAICTTEVRTTRLWSMFVGSSKLQKYIAVKILYRKHRLLLYTLTLFTLGPGLYSFFSWSRSPFQFLEETAF